LEKGHIVIVLVLILDLRLFDYEDESEDEEDLRINHKRRRWRSHAGLGRLTGLIFNEQETTIWTAEGQLAGSHHPKDGQGGV
jgi:hypothetical protein